MFPPPTRTTVITDCELEPIHLCGTIQPHGELLAIDTATRVVKFVSANVGKLLDANIELLGRELPEGKLSSCLHQAVKFEFQNLTIYEAELVASDSSSNLPQFLLHLDSLSRCESLQDLLNRVCQSVHKLTGYQRVMIYRFEQDWSGTVVAERVEDDYDSFLDLRFPAEDIPKQARDLYALNPIRYIPDVHYEPINILSQIQGAELDLSLSSLRGVSSIHLEYLRNMTVGASMSISIVVEGKLWGLIACHNKTARTVSPDVRQFCRTLSHLCSELIQTRIASVQQADKAEARTLQLELLDRLSHHNDPIQGLLLNQSKVLELTAAHGAVVWDNGVVATIGSAPAEEDLSRLVTALQKPESRVDLVCTEDSSTISAEFSDEFPQSASGIIAVSIDRNFKKWLLFFRKEITSEVQWAGEPVKTQDSANQRLHPRLSFKKWQEVVHGKSLRWTEAQKESAKIFGSYLSQRIDAADQLKAAIDAARQAVLLINPDGLVKYANERAAILFHRNSKELAEIPLTSLLPAGVETKYLNVQNSSVHARKINIDVSATPVSTPEGLFSFVSIEDVSRKVALEEERQRLTAELEASNSTMQQFLGVIAHDLRAPIVSIRNLAEWIESDSIKSLDSQSQTNLRSLKERATNMLEQLSSLLDFSKAGPLRSQPEKVDSQKMVESIVESIPLLQKYTVEVSNLPTFTTVKPPLEHVFRNLIENAAKYGGPDGGKIFISSTDLDEFYKFSVSDQGIGIPPEFQNEIFYPLRKLSKADPDSHGMGLAFVKRIVEQSGGEVNLESKVGLGSTFSFTWKKVWTGAVE